MWAQVLVQAWGRDLICNILWKVQVYNEKDWFGADLFRRLQIRQTCDLKLVAQSRQHSGYEWANALLLFVLHGVSHLGFLIML